MTQTWDTQAYERNGAFVHELAGGVLEWLNAQMGEFILDLGCGDGQLTQRIAATGAHVLGVDASLEMVSAARERGIEAELANAESLPFHDANVRCSVLKCRVALGARPGRDVDTGSSRAEAGRAVCCGDGRAGKHCGDSRGADGGVGSGMDTAIVRMASTTIRLRKLYETPEAARIQGCGDGDRFRGRQSWRRAEWQAGCAHFGAEFWMDCRRICARPWSERQRNSLRRRFRMKKGTGLPIMCGCGLLPSPNECDSASMAGSET